MSEICKQNESYFINLGSNFNSELVNKINNFLPEVNEKLQIFGRQNSHTTLSLMTLTMLNGQSPYRMLRQVLAEIEKRQLALSESQVTYAETLEKIKQLDSADDYVSVCKRKNYEVTVVSLTNKIQGALKDIGTLVDAYNLIKEKNNIVDWDENIFEQEEARFHVRRGFELAYRNLIQGSSLQPSTIEYLQQYGVHPQVAAAEVSGYIIYISEKIKKKELPDSTNLEDFLDQMADKYTDNVGQVAQRIFGTQEFISKDNMCLKSSSTSVE